MFPQGSWCGEVGGGGQKLPLILLLPLQFSAATRAAMTTTITTLLPMLHDHIYGDYDYDDDYC